MMADLHFQQAYSYKTVSDFKAIFSKMQFDDETRKILKILKNYKIEVIDQIRLKDFNDLWKCTIKYYPGNTDSCTFSFLFKPKKDEQS